MLPEKIKIGFEREKESIKRANGGILSPEQEQDIEMQLKEVEGVCNQEQEKKEHFGPLFKKSFGVEVDKFWIDDYRGFNLREFTDFMTEKYPDWMDYPGPSALILDKLGSEVDEMMREFCQSGAEERNKEHQQNPLDEGGLGGLPEGFDPDDLPPELRELFGL